MRHRLILSAVALVMAVIGLSAPPAQAAWSCSDGYCHAISHRQPDDGYDQALLVQCGNNLNQYAISEGQNSQAIGCNDVNRIYVRAGHSVNCYFDGYWWESWENQTPSGYWSATNLNGAWGQGMTYLCVDAWVGTITGGGGGGGGGGTW